MLTPEKVRSTVDCIADYIISTWHWFRGLYRLIVSYCQIRVKMRVVTLNNHNHSLQVRSMFAFCLLNRGNKVGDRQFRKHLSSRLVGFLTYYFV